MNLPQVTVCIITCNQRDYIQQCLDSVLAQSADVPMEILVGDDASNDGTSEIVARMAANHPELISHIRNARQLGASVNMQALLARARGTFITRVDGDDYWLPGKLTRQLEYLIANPVCSAVYTNALAVSEEGTVIGIFNDVGEARFDLPALLRRGNFLNNSSMLFRAGHKQAWIDLKGPLIDYRVHLLHARHGLVAQIGEPLVAYRVNARGSLLAAANDRVRQLYWEAILDVPRELVSDRDFAMGLADFLRRVLFRALRTRRWRLVYEWAPRVFTQSPYGVVRTGGLVAAAILRTTWVELAGRWRNGSDGWHGNVLYRR